MRPDLRTGAQAAAGQQRPGGGSPGALAHSSRRGDNTGMARANTKARVQLQLALLALDGTRPSGTPEWVSAAAPVVTQAAVGAGHWAAGRRQRALAAWACAAGSALVAWGLGTEAPTRAEMVKSTQQHRDLLRKLGIRLPPETPATAATQAPTARQQSWFGLAALGLTGIGMVTGVRSGLRHPQRLTAHAIASETFNTASYLLTAARAAQRRRPRIAAGRALSAAGSLARLRAAAAEPLR
jgi:hypothetical protein